MTLLHDCVACQYGLHDQHHEITQPVEEGVMGGARCPCTGDCAERNGRHDAARKHVELESSARTASRLER